MDARVHFRFDKFVTHADELTRMADADASVAVAGFRATLGRHAGFVRLVFTEPFLEQALLGVSAPGETRPAESSHARAELARYAYVHVSLWAEAGRTTLGVEDLRQLEQGDVILLEQGDLGLSGGGEGRAIVRLGSGLSGGIDVTAKLGPARVHCTVQGLHKGA